ncbi:metal-sensitive transcriptional regulator [Cellulomonas sp. SG140]|uniref:metal-sensitive transcriptional regulator n=1 Tax=Cellulomonas sp. SG140 TaxID=2976536 RepID=UPI002987FFAD|nr:metal-sensitive transcriptional regulator [Cellulomonas sp. SG140]
MPGPDRPRRPAATASSDAAPTVTADASASAVAVDPAPAAPDPVAVAKVSARLRRAHGQLAGVIRMLDDGRDCQDVVTQLAAVSRAIERAGFALVAANLRSCLRDPQGPDDVAADRLEQLFLSLA